MVSAAIIAEISAPHRASCEDCLPQSSTDCTLDRDNMPSREKWYRKNLCFQVKNMSVKVWETVSVCWAAHEKWEIHAKEEITFMILIAQFLGQEIKRHKDWINEMPAWNCELVAFSACSNRHVGMSSPTNPPGLLGSGHACAASLICNKARIRKEALRNRWLNMWIWGHIQKRQGRDRYQTVDFLETCSQRMPKGARNYENIECTEKYVMSILLSTKNHCMLFVGSSDPKTHSTAFQTPQHLHCCLGVLIKLRMKNKASMSTRI